MFEILQNNFLDFMRGFNIYPQNKNHPESSIKITQNDNGVERIEYDLSMEDISANLKVKLYSTTSSLDAQGLKPHYATVFEALGNKTIGVFFAEVVLEAISSI